MLVPMMNTARSLRFRFLLLALAVSLTACTTLAAGKIEGTYQNAQGNASIEFMSGGKAHFSFHGVGGDGKYTIEGMKLTFMFDGEKLVFTINDDGSLSGPPDSFVNRLKKK